MWWHCDQLGDQQELRAMTMGGCSVAAHERSGDDGQRTGERMDESSPCQADGTGRREDASCIARPRVLSAAGVSPAIVPTAQAASRPPRWQAAGQEHPPAHSLPTTAVLRGHSQV